MGRPGVGQGGIMTEIRECSDREGVAIMAGLGGNYDREYATRLQGL